MKKIILVAFVTIGALLFTGCAGGAGPLPMEKITVGMSKQQAVQLLGRPIKREIKNFKGKTVELYYYVDISTKWATGNIWVGGTQKMYETHYGLLFYQNRLVKYEILNESQPNHVQEIRYR